MNFTIDEKIRLLTGKNGWEIDNLDGKLGKVYMVDGPMGVRMHMFVDNYLDVTRVRKATAYPCATVLANTWNKALSRKTGDAIADECIEKGADILLGPGINIKRTPLCGRNFEYFSEDPYLTGVMAREYIDGVQSRGVGVSLKHFCANNREYDRFYQSSNVDDRALREIYLRAFAISLEAKPWTVMSAYNPVNGVLACQNKRLLQDVLRDEMGFDGVIVSDWNACRNRAEALRASCDLDMPYRAESASELRSALSQDPSLENKMDESVSRLVELTDKVRQAGKIKRVKYDKNYRHDLALSVAEEGIVMLKNDGGLLPLNKGRIAVIGELSEYPARGGGSSCVESDYEHNKPLRDLLADRMPTGEVSFSRAYFGDFKNTVFNVREALDMAAESDAVVVCVGNDKYIELEGTDRTGIKLLDVQQDLIKKLSAHNDNVIVCIFSGSVVDVSDWIDSVKAVLYCGFAGEAGLEALANILAGRVSPSGKLTETFVNSLEDTFTKSEVGDGYNENYDDGIYVGYRYYDKNNVPVRYPFGYGLSYATFKYGDLEVTEQGQTLEVKYEVENVSDYPAKEVSQVYFGVRNGSVDRACRELVGFSKDIIGAHCRKKVKLQINLADMRYYDDKTSQWVLEGGEYLIQVGSSSRNLHLQAIVDIKERIYSK